MTFGWAGRIICVDLSKGKIIKQDLPMQLAKGYLGGRGINVKILYDEVGSEVEPLSPENRLIFGCGPLVGTLAPSCSRWNVTARSPLTDILGDSNAGGHWAPELKWAGYDNIVVTGRAEKPTYLWINNDDIELKGATHIWGKTLTEASEMIKEETGDEDTKICSIGPAGENLVKTALVMSDLTRAAGRCGMGAVMGSKKLKAIAVRGTKGVKIAKPDEFESLCTEAYNQLLSHPMYKHWSTQGTLHLLKGVNAAGRLKIKNWTENVLRDEEADAISGETFLQHYSLKNKGCFNCPISCSHYYRVRGGPYDGTVGEGPEYEAQAGFGSNLYIINWPAILHMNTLVNELGLDVCSVSTTLSWAMECYEKGLVTDKDTGGISLNWGNDEAAVQMIKNIAYRKGFGDVLAEGAYAASQKVGKGSERFVIHSKKLEWTGTELRGSFGWALAYATSTRGADHLRALMYVASLKAYAEQARKLFGVPPEATDGWSPKGKPFFVKYLEDLGAVIDSLGLCKTPSLCLMIESYFRPDPLAKIVSAATGWDIDGNGLMKIGERIYHVEKAFNIKLGYGRREHDTIPERFVKEFLPSPPRNTAKALVKLDPMLDEYYKLRGWDVKTGLIPRTKLEELNLTYIADQLEELNRIPRGKKR